MELYTTGYVLLANLLICLVCFSLPQL